MKNEKLSYTNFEYGKLNRRIDESNLKRMKKSIKEFGLLTTLTVTKRKSKYFIIDGQHRFLAMKELNMDINRDMLNIKPYGGEKWLINIMSEMNGRVLRWKGMNYVEVYAASGDQTYKNILDFCNTFPDFAITAYIPILSIGSKKGSKCTRHYLQTGEFEVGSWKLSMAVANALMEIKQYTDLYKHFQFVKAFCKIFTHPEFDNNEFINQLEKGKHIRSGQDIFYGTANVEVFLSLIKDVYNKDKRRHNRVDW
jgi:hypothetical protein